MNYFYYHYPVMNFSCKQQYTIYPIGYVRRRENNTFLEIIERYKPCLKELTTYSHAHVIWWFHETDQQEQRHNLVFQPPFKAPPLGVFASRAPVRPNPVAVTVVSIISVDAKKGIVIIPEIDAEDGTPIIDIKPYMPHYDRVKHYTLPEWAAAWSQWVPEAGTGLNPKQE